MNRTIHNIGVLEATASCNLKCPSCVVWTDKLNEFVTASTTEKAITLFDFFNVKQVQLYWRGDPCVHPKLYEIAEQLGKYITIVSTNGCTKYCSDKEYMTRLLNSVNHYAVCLDGWNQETLSKYRVGANYNKIIHGIRLASSIKSDCDKILTVLMFKHNEGKEDHFESLADKYGFRLELKKPNILGKKELTQAEQDEWLHPDNNRYLNGVHQSTTNCPEGNIIVSATGGVPLCGQYTDIPNGLGTVNQSPETILNKYKSIESKMYNRELPKCDKCLCLCVDS